MKLANPRLMGGCGTGDWACAAQGRIRAEMITGDSRMDIGGPFMRSPHYAQAGTGLSCPRLRGF